MTEKLQLHVNTFGPRVPSEFRRQLFPVTRGKNVSETPGSPWENGYVDSFNGKLRDELLNGEIFETLWEAQVMVEQWRVEHNTIRPHS